VVAGSLRLQQEGDLHAAFERYWYPGYVHTVDFLNEELRITDLVIGRAVVRAPADSPHDWDQAVTVPVSWTYTATTGAYRAGPCAGEYVLVRSGDDDPWRIASSRMLPVRRPSV